MAAFDPTAIDHVGAPVDPLLADADEGLHQPDEAAGEERELKDAILFVVDCGHRAAHERLSEHRGSIVSEALFTAASVLKTKVVTSPDDKIGVALYGITEKNNPNNFQGIYMLQDLERPSAQRIKRLEQEAARTQAQFEERYGARQRVPLADVFWTCTTVFNLSAPPKQFHPRVFLFTGNDSPCESKAEQEAAETRAQDLMDLGVEVEFFPLSPPGRPFSMERFWGRVLPKDFEDYIDYVETACLRVEELERRVRRRVHRKRTLQRIAFQICPEVEVAVQVYVTILEARVPAPVHLMNENNKELKSETKHLCERTGAILHPLEDVETYVELANERVYMSRKEIAEARTFCEPGLSLIGFKAASTLRSHHRIFHSYFLYPNDKGVKGSAAFLAALIEKMLERKQIALARYFPRRNSEPVLVALLPQAESEDPSGFDQVRQPGFHMVRLPWGEEIRQLEFPAPDGAHVPPGVAEAASRVVDAMSLHAFAPGCAQNPVLQRHYAAVQALALGEDQPEETVDMLQPDAAALEEKAPLLQAWRRELDSAAPPVAVGPAKRAAEDGLEEAPRARARREAPLVPPEGLEAMRAMVQSGEVDRLTVPVLRDWLKAQGVACSGKKADLVERVRAMA